jgi:hypothetical protein
MYLPVIPAPGRLRLKDQEFRVSLDYTERLCPKIKKTNLENSKSSEHLCTIDKNIRI